MIYSVICLKTHIVLLSGGRFVQLLHGQSNPVSNPVKCPNFQALLSNDYYYLKSIQVVNDKTFVKMQKGHQILCPNPLKNIYRYKYTCTDKSMKSVYNYIVFYE